MPGSVPTRTNQIERLPIAGDLRDEASVRGELWTEPVEVVFKRDEKSAKRWAALVFDTRGVTTGFESPNVQRL